MGLQPHDLFETAAHTIAHDCIAHFFTDCEANTAYTGVRCQQHTHAVTSKPLSALLHVQKSGTGQQTHRFAQSIR